MKYQNTKTGAVIDSPCVISGGDWVVEKASPTEKEKPSKKAKEAE